jgi:protein-tyrosine phosphatase
MATAATNPPHDRAVELQGVTNFRDFGGYQGAGGRRVRWGHLYRSGQLSELNEADRAAIEALRLDRIFDLRVEEELERAPNALGPRERERIVHVALYPGSAHTYRERLLDGTADAAHIAEMMAMINRDLARDHTAEYASLLREVVRARGPVLIHCAAGKDRTGFGVAMVLFALGVSREQVMEDYLLSRTHFDSDRVLVEQQRLYEEKGAPPIAAEVLRPLVAVEPVYLGAAFQEIEAMCGSIEAYLAGPLACSSADQERLRERLLE